MDQAKRPRSTVGAAMLVMAAGTTVAFGFLVGPGSSHFGVTTAQFLLWYSIFTISTAIAGSLTGRLSEKLGINLLVNIGGTPGMAAQIAGNTRPEPFGFGSAILKVVDAEEIPLRMFFGVELTICR
ncbi:hypothetical protein [Arthrobacter sp. W4I7]|uniref:hypothetical protein n=1 Tax=Arthrobacter sp. W4I7 TaxID=3042296 RepID=UPI002789FCE3|nr:hypothetical protein [Arthrobacter sp. W4I7]MDQ0691444.1 hypothetical protein [Arthrobacter sp. W4I7]